MRIVEYGSTKEECYEMARRINEKKVAVSYSRLYQSLESSKERLGLDVSLKWHSCRIGAATRGNSLGEMW